MTIQPTAVYAPGQPYPGNAVEPTPSFYQTYNTRTLGGSGGGGGGYTPPPSGGGGGGFNYGGGFLHNQFQRLPGGGQPVQVPNGVPKFLGGRQILLFTWIAAMMMVSLDEWHTHHVLPRPARLWYTSLTYGLMALASIFDPLVPLINMFAIGFTIAVAYDYYNGSGQFGAFGASESKAAATGGATA